MASTTATDDIVIVTANEMVTDTTGSLTVNAAALTDTGAFLNFTSNENSTATINVTGGAGADVFTAGTEKSNFSGGSGIDTFNFTSAQLTVDDTIAGGTGVDILNMSDAATVIDADFTNVTSVETLVGATTNTVTLGALANASGLATITGTGAVVDTVTVGAGFTNALRVNIATGNDSISASASAAALTIAAAAASITTDDALVGGTGTGDVLSLTADNSTTGAVFGSSVSGFETITVVASTTATDDIVIVSSNSMVAAGGTLHVNGTALTNTNATLTFNGSAELDGKFSIDGGAGVDTITGGLGADTIVGGAGGDSLVGGLGADSITGGEGADDITGGSGADTIILTESTAAIDTLFYTSPIGSQGDVITGFAAGTGVDVVSFAATLLVNNTTNKVNTLAEIAVNGTVGANDVLIEITTSLSGDLTSAVNIAELLSGLTTTNLASGESVVISVGNASNSYLWYFAEDGVAGIQASNLTLIATLMGVVAGGLANGDLTSA